MRKTLSILLSLLLILMSVPVFAEGSDLIPAATSPRTTLLDLSNTNSSTSSTSQGWSFNPTGNSGKPKLTLNAYGNANAHSAPIIVPPNTTIVVNGDCYIDNSYMQEKYSVITARCNGYLHIEGDGTLNLYSDVYQGFSINKESGSESNHNDDLVIENVTVNCFNHERDMYTASSNEACIYAYKSITIRNAVINAHYGRWGIRCWGETPIGGVSEETADEILIENSTVNIQNESENGINWYAIGIENTFGRIRITGDSHVTINAGSKSIYAYLSCVVEGGTVDIRSSTAGTYTDSYALVQCNNLVLKNGLTRFRVTPTRYVGTVLLYCKSEGESVLGSDLTVTYGSFSGGNYTPGTDPETGLPLLEITDGSVGILLGDVNCDGVVDFSDAATLAAYLMGAGEISEQGMINANANLDSTVSIADITAIYTIIMSK